MTEEKTEFIKFDDMKISEEIKKNSKIIEKHSDVFPHPMFISKIPYKGFNVLIGNPRPQKKMDSYYRKRSKYGWWTYCAKKDEFDELDKQVLDKHLEYGQYREGDHSFCSDNQHEEEKFYTLHPNDMVKEVKEKIDRFYENKEKLKNENKKSD